MLAGSLNSPPITSSLCLLQGVESLLILLLLTDLAIQLYEAGAGIEDLVHHHSIATLDAALENIFCEVLKLLFEVSYLVAGLTPGGLRSLSAALLRQRPV